jgi:hypothetical protein
MKPQVTVQQAMDVTVLKENRPGTPTVPGLRLAVVAVLLIMVMLAAEVAAAGVPHTGLAGEPVAEAIEEFEATQTAMSPVPHTAAMMPTAELKKYNA